MRRLGELVELTKEYIDGEPLQNTVINFINKYYDIEMTSFQEWSLVKHFREYLASCTNLIDNFDWDDYCYIHLELKSEVKTISRQYFKYLLENDLYFGKYREYLSNNMWIMDFSKGIYPQNTFYKGSKPYYFYQVNNDENNSITRFNIKTYNKFIKDILIAFILTLTNKELKTTRFKVFVNLFQDSLIAYSGELNCVKDFNLNTFKKQYRFYKKIPHHDHSLTFILCRFYLFIYDYLETNGNNYKLFNDNDGIDKYFLYRRDFSKYYDEGYKVVYLNVYDSIPTSDRWMVAPNGQEVTSLAKTALDYHPISYYDVYDENYKAAFKSWFWYYDQSLFSKEKESYCIKNFYLFLKEIRNKKVPQETIPFNSKETRNCYDLSINDIIHFRAYLNSKYDSNTTIKANLIAVKKFLAYSKEQNLLDFNVNILNYFDGVKKDVSQPNPLIREDLNIVTKRYKELSNNGIFEKLQYCIYQLLITTNLRIWEVLKLKRDCFGDTIKVDQYIVKTEYDSEQKIQINVKRKARDGVPGENISIYTYRLLSDAIALTTELSITADTNIKDYIFLYVSTNRIIKHISKDSINRYLGNILTDVGLAKTYTLYNLRDTYMTYIYDEGKKRGLTIEEIHPATGHKDITTTIKHYRKSDVKTYLEAFYKIKIGNVQINGTIVKSIYDLEIKTDDIKSINVSEGCGFCKNGGCKDLKRVDCLICSFFVTTLDNLKSFKNRIERIDFSIKNESNEHEKEHLLKIKQLLLSYVEKLYLLRGESLDDTIKQN